MQGKQLRLRHQQQESSPPKFVHAANPFGRPSDRAQMRPIRRNNYQNHQLYYNRISSPSSQANEQPNRRQLKPPKTQATALLILFACCLFQLVASNPLIGSHYQQAAAMMPSYYALAPMGVYPAAGGNPAAQLPFFSPGADLFAGGPLYPAASATHLAPYPFIGGFNPLLEATRRSLIGSASVPRSGRHGKRASANNAASDEQESDEQRALGDIPLSFIEPDPPSSLTERISESFSALGAGVKNHFRSMSENFSETMDDIKDAWRPANSNGGSSDGPNKRRG